QVNAADFRLHPQSAGRGAGPDGRDLGADVELVGPGQAYEKWKATPAYQQWLTDTNQAVKPFAVLARDGNAERQFVTLAEAVTEARGGDTIEVRGDGPFVTPSVDLGSKALTMRAAS